MGYWSSYLGVGYGGTCSGPTSATSGTLLFSAARADRGLVVPALALWRLRVDAALALRAVPAGAGAASAC